MSSKKKHVAPPLAALAREHGISRETLRRWRDSGIDVQDAAAVAARVALAKVADAETLADLKRRKLRLEAERLETIVAREKAELVPMAEVREFIIVITQTYRAALNALCGVLPGELEGLSAAAIQKVLIRRCDEILTQISENKFTTAPYGKAKPTKK